MNKARIAIGLLLGIILIVVFDTAYNPCVTINIETNLTT